MRSMKIFLLTNFDGRRGSSWLDFTRHLMVKYAAKMNMQFTDATSLTPAKWCRTRTQCIHERKRAKMRKVDVILTSLMRSKPGSWIWWVDADTAIGDSTYDVRHILKKGENENASVILMKRRSITSSNLFLRHTSTGLAFVSHWKAHLRESRVHERRWVDQGALNDFLCDWRGQVHPNWTSAVQLVDCMCTDTNRACKSRWCEHLVQNKPLQRGAFLLHAAGCRSTSQCIRHMVHAVSTPVSVTTQAHPTWCAVLSATVEPHYDVDFLTQRDPASRLSVYERSLIQWAAAGMNATFVDNSHANLSKLLPLQTGTLKISQFPVSRINRNKGVAERDSVFREVDQGRCHSSHIVKVTGRFCPARIARALKGCSPHAELVVQSSSHRSSRVLFRQQAQIFGWKRGGLFESAYRYWTGTFIIESLLRRYAQMLPEAQVCRLPPLRLARAVQTGGFGNLVSVL